MNGIFDRNRTVIKVTAAGLDDEAKTRVMVNTDRCTMHTQRQLGPRVERIRPQHITLDIPIRKSPSLHSTFSSFIILYGHDDTQQSHFSRGA